MDSGRIVEAAEYESVVGQSCLAAGDRAGGDRSLRVVDEEGLRKPNDLLTVERLLVGRQNHRIRDDVVYEISAGRAGEAEIADLNRSCTAGKDADARVPGVAHQIDGDVHIEVAQQPGGVRVGLSRHIDEAIEAPDQPFADRTVVIAENERPITSNRLRSCSSNSSASWYPITCERKSADT